MIKIRIFVFLIALVVVFYCGTIVNASAEEAPDSMIGEVFPEENEEPGPMDEDTVGTEKELDEWCMAHDGIGGTVYLNSNITVEHGISGGYRGGHIVIDTGAFGVIFDGGCIALYDFEIVGEGVDNPVVTVIDASPRGWWAMGNWNNNVAFLNITALGRSGEGGVALHIRQEDDGKLFDVNMAGEENGLIRSYGDGAIGILIDNPLEIYCFRVEADGANSMSVRAPDGTSLLFCKLYASGDGAAVANSGVTLDTCAAYPKPAGATVITRDFSGLAGNMFYLPVKQYESIFIGAAHRLGLFWLVGSDGSEISQVLAAQWCEEAIDAIDTGISGKYTVEGSVILTPVFQGLGLTERFPLTLIIDVRDPAIPCIGDVSFSDWDGKPRRCSFGKTMTRRKTDSYFGAATTAAKHGMILPARRSLNGLTGLQTASFSIMRNLMLRLCFALKYRVLGSPTL